MFYLKVIEFLVSYDIVILPVVFALVWVFGIVNWSRNIYRRQNKKFAVCQRSILLNPKLTGVYVAMLTEEYRRQWRAYVNSNAQRPGQVFEFVPRKNKIVCVPLFVLCAVVSTAYFAVFVWTLAHREYAVFQLALWLSFALVMVINKIVFCGKEKRARRCFGRFVAQLNAQNAHKNATKSVAEQLDELKKQGATDNALERASQLLRQNGLESNRTVQEQQQINQALNGLLQAYSRNAAQKL